MLTERREDDVDLAELIERLRAMLVQGLVVGKDVEANLEPVSLAGHRATALALVFSELLPERARARRRDGRGSSWRSRTAMSRWRSRTTAAGSTAGGDEGTGLSIVRALVRDELGGTIVLTSEPGLRAEVVFPA